MTPLTDLNLNLKNKTATLGIIGLGYVGLPVACIFAQAGFTVIGLDTKAERVAQINAGKSPIEGQEPGLAELLENVVNAGRLQAATDYTQLAKAGAILIAVDTPVDENNIPQYVALRSACQSLGRVIKPGTLVVIESTIAPGTVNKVIQPILETESGLKAHRDFFLGACPERVMPGKLLANLRQMSRVCGGGTPETAQTMITLYRHVVEADLDPADIITAELVKTAENTYRDVQIAFANEVALICEANNADVWQVRELVNKSPGRTMHLPGGGVGGHCIPKDPWLLAYSAGESVSPRLIPAARAVNESMPPHVADLVEQALLSIGLDIGGAGVAVLGYAYLEDSDDTRHSPGAALIARLEDRGAAVVIHDPWVAPYQTDLYETVTGADAVVLMVKHSAYRKLNLSRLKAVLRTPIIIDARGFFDPPQVEASGFIYRGVGRGNK